MPLGGMSQREYHDPRGVAVQPMDQQRFGERGLDAGDQAIGQMRAFAGNAEQA